jgi:hypothetical protein
LEERVNHYFTVRVDTEELGQAIKVIEERVFFDEDYGFPYVIDRAIHPDSIVVDELVNYVRTPEWSVSMLEDIAELVSEVRDIDPDYEPDDEHAWQSH